MKRKLAILGLTTFLWITSSLTVTATDVNSYNPTEPEKQLGDIKTIDIDESGTLSLNDNSLQASLDDEGNVYIETVKRPKVFASDDKKSLTIYYFLDKDGDIFSMNLKQDKYLEDKEDNQVLLKKVKFLEGRNGVADSKDGFKSNLVPEKFLPKTDLVQEEKSESNYMVGMLLIFLIADILIIYKLFFSKKSKEKEEDIND